MVRNDGDSVCKLAFVSFVSSRMICLEVTIVDARKKQRNENNKMNIFALTLVREGSYQTNDSEEKSLEPASLFFTDGRIGQNCGQHFTQGFKLEAS